jgi:hypothetical protein
MAGSARIGRLTVLLAAAVAVAVIAGLVAVAWWRDDLSRQAYAVRVPLPGASAQRVVVAYLQALDAHDVATAEALSTAGFRSETQSWLRSTASVRHIKIQNVVYYARQREYDVNVTFRYGSHWWKQDSSFPDGNEYWGYTLTPRHGRLLISDDGTG